MDIFIRVIQNFVIKLISSQIITIMNKIIENNFHFFFHPYINNNYKQSTIWYFDVNNYYQLTILMVY